MKDTQVDAVVTPSGIAVEEGRDRTFVTLASPESRLPAPKMLPMLSSAVFSYPKTGEHERWAFLSTFVIAVHRLRKTEVSSQMKRPTSSVRLVTTRQMRVVRTDAQEVRSSLCYPLPAAPLS
jgi:hypothetical protein